MSGSDVNVRYVTATGTVASGRRRLVSIQEVDGMEGDIITMSEIFSFVRTSMDQDGNVMGDLRPTGVVPKFYRTLASKGVDLPISVFQPEHDGTH